jgi:hypothetical protein
VIAAKCDEQPFSRTVWNDRIGPENEPAAREGAWGEGVAMTAASRLP